MTQSLPPLALSVRQPWAWAIIYGGKIIENRSLGGIRSGNMVPGRIAIHAATGMTQKEYRLGAWRLKEHGVTCPEALDLPRGAIIGAVEVVKIITESDSEWFGGEAGLLLRDPQPCDPIPARGALGYFRWQRAPDLAKPLPWMALPSAGAGGLFDDLPHSFKQPPAKPFGPSRK